MFLHELCISILRFASCRQFLHPCLSWMYITSAVGQPEGRDEKLFPQIRILLLLWSCRFHFVHEANRVEREGLCSFLSICIEGQKKWKKLGKKKEKSDSEKKTFNSKRITTEEIRHFLTPSCDPSFIFARPIFSLPLSAASHLHSIHPCDWNAGNAK